MADILVCVTSLADYGREFSFDRLGGWRAEWWAALQAEVGGALAGGGELWEFETAGFQSLAGESGLAVVRGGQVVRRWPLWKS